LSRGAVPLFRGGLPALVLHPAAIEARRGMVAKGRRLSMSVRVIDAA
jgi:hypothetical protein